MGVSSSPLGGMRGWGRSVKIDFRVPFSRSPTRTKPPRELFSQKELSWSFSIQIRLKNSPRKIFTKKVVMEQYERKARMANLRDYDHLAKEHDFVEVCEWHNGEGFDVTIGEKQFTLTWGEFTAITVLANYRGK